MLNFEEQNKLKHRGRKLQVIFVWRWGWGRNAIFRDWRAVLHGNIDRPVEEGPGLALCYTKKLGIVFSLVFKTIKKLF